MAKNNYLFHSDYLKTRDTKNKSIMIAKTKKSYLIGPKINHSFYKESFYRRIKSNSIYTTKIYKKMVKKKCDLLINKYKNEQAKIFYRKQGGIEKNKIVSKIGEEEVCEVSFLFEL